MSVTRRIALRRAPPPDRHRSSPASYPPLVQPLAPGQILDGRYRLVSPLGEGGQGSVWLAIDTLAPARRVALKILRGPEARSVDVDRLRREARALARLSHPSLLRCHGLFEDLARHVLALVLDVIDGTSLASLTDDPRLTPALRSRVLEHVAGALAYVHAEGLVHRDVKPENVLVRRDFFDRPDDPERVKLVDLGIAAPTGNPQPLTEPGSVIGTVPYLAPELIDPSCWREPIGGPGRDVFAFGIMAMELLRGEHPAGVPPASRIADYTRAYRDWDARGGWPPGIRDDPHELLFARCLALRASERAKDAREIVSLLQPTLQVAATRTVEQRRPPTARRPAPAALRAAPEVRRPSKTLPDAPSEVPPTEREPRRATAGLAIAIALIGVPVTAAIAFGLTRSSIDADDPSPIVTTPPTRSPSPLSTLAPSSVTPSPSVPSTPPVASCPSATRSVARACVDIYPVALDVYVQSMGVRPDRPEPLGPGARAKECNTRGAEPVTCVDASDAERFCRARGGRLPTEEELCFDGCTPPDYALPPQCRFYEWTSSAAREAPQNRRLVGCRHQVQNDPRSRNGDVGFRCAADPIYAP